MKQQILDILVELDKWRAERKLSIESQREGYIRNVMEELGELAEAIKTNNEHEYIDALCDIMVFTGNLIEASFFDKHVKEATMESLQKEFEEYFLKNSRNDLVLLVQHVCYLAERVYDPDVTDTPCILGNFIDIYHVCNYLAKEKGYNLDLTMKEVLKQINSRQGAWNEDLKKWVKDTSDEAKSKEYQANFYRCKLS